MKKVICIESRISNDGRDKVIKDNIYSVVSNTALKSGKPAYQLAELPSDCKADIRLFRDYEEPPVLVTFTKIVETYPIHAN